MPAWNGSRKVPSWIQCKLFHHTRITTKDVEKEVEKNEDGMQNDPETFRDCSRVYTVILVTVPYNQEIHESMELDDDMETDASNELQNYIVLDREKLQKFFPQPLRDYTFRGICGRLNINCAPVGDATRLLGLDEIQEKEFAEERLKGGFASKDDLPFEVEHDQLAFIEF